MRAWKKMRAQLRLIAILLIAGVTASACGESVIGDWPTEVHGQVVAEDGQPISSAFVTLEVARLISIWDTPGVGVQTTSEGRFALKGIRPGRYIAKFNVEGATQLWPFAETVSPTFSVEEGRVSVAPTLTAKRARMITIKGMVSAPDGTPIRGVLLDFWVDFPSGGQAHSVSSKSDGFARFVVELTADSDYMVRVGPEREDWGRTEFVANGEFVTITARPR
jgi:hypothetical protein